MSKAVEYIRNLARKQQEEQPVATIGYLDFSLELANFSCEDIVYENDIEVLQEDGLVSSEAYLFNGGRVSADLYKDPVSEEATPLNCEDEEHQPIPKKENIQYEL